MHIGGKMLDTVERFFSQEREYGFFIPSIKHVKGHTQVFGGIGATGPEIIQPLHLMALPLESHHGVGSDVARSPRDQNSHTDISARR
jgi:hypothetical protein